MPQPPEYKNSYKFTQIFRKMKSAIFPLVCFQLLVTLFTGTSCKYSTQTNSKPEYALVIHGGAGAYDFGSSPERDSSYIRSLLSVVNLGDSLLRAGVHALDVVEQCIKLMEDDTLFNAGRGSVLNESGEVSMDASIMNGADEMAGAVAGLSTTRHPISAARQVMEQTSHVMLSGEGADVFAISKNLEQMPPYWFVTQKSIRAREKQIEKNQNEKLGTVGCVAFDKNGNLAAGTSTGGMNMKKWGRIGDSPIIGAGTYASNNICAISCTGHGEFFIRNVVAYDVAARMKYKGETLQQAADAIIKHQLAEQKGDGGLIGIDKYGKIYTCFNTPSMFRASVSSGEKPAAFIK
jgi:L-asparaginase / beta-aspartyl-peptidase